jgi:deazaflavin-dependent oxidoreductase (nitroreductase family)
MFVVFNRVVNPLVRSLLRSPAHGLLSWRLLLLEVTGRRSGQTFTFPVQYGRDGNAFVVVPALPEKKRWWRNLRSPAPVAYWWQGRRVEGTGRVVSDPEEKARSLAAYRKGRRFEMKSLDPAKAVVVRIEPST